MGTEAQDALAHRRLQREIVTRQREEKLKLKKQLRRQNYLSARKEKATGKHSSANSTILVPRKYWTPQDVLKGLEDQGKAKRRLGGGYVAGDLSELQKVILLCPLCKHGFDWKKHHYYNVAHYDRIKAIGRCDVCRVQSNQLGLYLHEAHVGLSWTPRAQLQQQRRKAALVG